MRTAILIGLIFASCVASSRMEKIQPLDVKPGLWEVTTAVATGDQMPIPAGLLEKLTPEQHARIEERMKARSSGEMKTITRRQCLTREQVEKGASFLEEQKSCNRTVLASTSSRLDLRVKCAEQGKTNETNLKIEALDSESVTGTVQVVMAGGARSANSGSTFTAKWIDPVCKPE